MIIGGGAAGFFTAINLAEMAKANGVGLQVQILEASDSVLKKVRISGGGRCNVTHHQFDVRQLCTNYPRGSKELLSAMQRFQPRDTVEWFRERGVRLVAEDDGRMFPHTNESATVIQCLTRAAEAGKVRVRTNTAVTGVAKMENSGYLIQVRGAEDIKADAVMIATGSSPAGYKFAKSLGHKVTELAPSLFSFKITDPLLTELSGLSFPLAGVKLVVPGERSFAEDGPLLITHWGLSGPAVLKISAWAAREMKRVGYKAVLTVNWMGNQPLESIAAQIRTLKDSAAKSHIGNSGPQAVQKRFWHNLLAKLQIPQDKKWADVPKKEMHEITQHLFASRFEVLGKNRYKEEFVECGGVDLKEIDFKTMESKICPGLFFAGELLDIDGITGGFNFQNAWTGGWIAAQALSGKERNWMV